MRGTTAWALLAAALVVAGCRSPFGSTPEDPEAGRVGRGIHGWPAYESAPHGEGWRTDVLWPGFSTVEAGEADGLARTQVLIPVFLFESEGERRRVGFLRPVWDLETEGDEVYDLDVLWPFFKWKDTPTTEERRAFPVYSSKEDTDGDGYFHLWPLYGHAWSDTRDQRWVFTPLFSHTSDPENEVSLWDLPWPLIHFGHDGDERHVRVLPLLWHSEDADEHQTVVFPFIWDIEGHGASFEMVFPLYSKFREGDDRVDAIVPPLYVTGNDDDEEFTWIVAPLFRYGEEPDAWRTHLFPVLWLERQDDGDGYTHIWPLFSWEQFGDDREAGIIWPFFRHEWDENGFTTHFPWPLVEVARRPGRAKTEVWPLFCDRTWTADNDGTEVAHREGNVLLFLSNWESHGEDDRDFRILWKLLQSSHEAGKDTFVLNPLFRHESNDAGDTYWSFLFGLVARKQEQGAVDWRFLWFL